MECIFCSIFFSFAAFSFFAVDVETSIWKKRATGSSTSKPATFLSPEYEWQDTFRIQESIWV